MNWRQTMALELFARSSRPVRYHQTPGIGEKTWKALIAKALIAPRADLASAHEKAWWQIPHEITDEGRQALGVTP